MGAVIEVSYFNSFLLKDVGKLQSSTNYESNGLWPSLPWNPSGFPTFPLLASSINSFPYEWYVEESRIRGGFNNTSTELGPRAYLSESNDDEKVLQSSLIYSGLFNSNFYSGELAHLFCVCMHEKNCLSPVRKVSSKNCIIKL